MLGFGLILKLRGLSEAKMGHTDFLLGVFALLAYFTKLVLFEMYHI